MQEVHNIMKSTDLWTAVPYGMVEVCKPFREISRLHFKSPLVKMDAVASSRISITLCGFTHEKHHCKNLKSYKREVCDLYSSSVMSQR